MKEYLEEQYIEDDIDFEEDEIDIMQYVTKLLHNWKFVVKAGCVGMIVGLIFALSVVKTYTSTATLAPEVTSKSSGGGLSSLASLAGVNLGSLSSSDALNPDLYPQIVNSNPFRVELLDTEITYIDKKGEQKMPLYVYLDQYRKKAWYTTLLSAPMDVMGWVMAKIKGIDTEDDAEYYQGCINPEKLTITQYNKVKYLSEHTSITVDKKTSVITIAANMGQPQIAKQVCDKIIENLENYVFEYRTEKSRMDVEYYQKLTQESREAYYAAQQKYARYVDSNQGVIRNSFMIESERLRNESELAFQLYNSTSQQLQLAEAKIQLETPVCITINPSTVPIKGSPSRAKTLIVWVFLFAFAACAWAMFGDVVMSYVAKMRDPEEEIVEE